MTTEYEGITFEHPGHATIRMETSDNVVGFIDPCSKVLLDTSVDTDVVFSTHND